MTTENESGGKPVQDLFAGSGGLLSGLRKGGRSRSMPPVEVDTAVVAFDLALRRALDRGVHTFVREDGTEREFNWRWSQPWPGLSRTFLRSVHEMSEPGGPIASEKAAQSYQAWVKPFFVWLSDQDPERRCGDGLNPLGPEVFRRWKAFLDGRVAREELKSKTAYNYKGAVTRVLENVLKRRPEDLSPEWREEHLYQDDFDQDYDAREPYSVAEALRITREAARILVQLQRPEAAGERNGRLEQLSIYTLVGLKLGIETECIDRLRARDLAPTDDGKRLRIRYVKRRLPGRPGRRAKSVSGEDWGEASEEVGSFRTVGGALAYARRQARARGVLEDGSLWIRPLTAADFRWFTDQLHGRGLRADDGGLLKVDRTRFRATYKSARMLKSGGQLSLVADDHSKSVAARHYLENEHLQPFYEQAIVDAGMEALAFALREPKIVDLPADAPDGDVAAAAESAGATPEEVRRALNGETDAWLASCKDFFNTPFDPAGNSCSKAFWGCLDCANSLVTRRNLPRLLRFLSHLVDQRKRLPTAEWEAKFGRSYRQITETTLPRFPPDAVAEARAIAEGIDGTLHLPPELQSA